MAPPSERAQANKRVYSTKFSNVKLVKYLQPNYVLFNELKNIIDNYPKNNKTQININNLLLNHGN
jgi:hypothetical protein